MVPSPKIVQVTGSWSDAVFDVRVGTLYASPDGVNQGIHQS
jgi:hypothetical protein